MNSILAISRSFSNSAAPVLDLQGIGQLYRDYEIIEPQGDVLQRIFGSDPSQGESADPLADDRIPYQPRIPHRDLRQELLEKLEAFGYLLILGRRGTGKTREAAEVAQQLNQEGWTVLHLKVGAWLDVPIADRLAELGKNRKLLFVLDDLNEKMHFSHCHQPEPHSARSALETRYISLVDRLTQTLDACDRVCTPAQVLVLATACNEAQSDIPGEPSEWEKLQWERYPHWWGRFAVFELPEPEDTAIAGLLEAVVPQIRLPQQPENYDEIAGMGDGTFANVVENLVYLRNRCLPLTAEYYNETLGLTWRRRYRDAVRRSRMARYIYDAIDILRQFDCPLERPAIERTAIAIMPGNPWQKLWSRLTSGLVLEELSRAERLLRPRSGQIEAKGTRLSVQEYAPRLMRVLFKLSDRSSVASMASVLLNFGISLWNLNDLDKALAAFDRVLEMEPKSGLVWFFRGNVLYELGRFQEAISSYDKQLELKPDDWASRYNSGVAWERLQRYDKAVIRYDRILAESPEIPRVWRARGDALWQLGEFQQAIESYDRAIELDADNSGLWRDRGLALAELGNDREAISSYAKAVERDPDDVEAWYACGLALAALGRNQDALVSYDNAIAAQSDFAPAWNKRGLAYFDLQNYPEALASYDRAIDLEKNNAELWYDRGLVLCYLHRYREAISNYDRAISLQADYHQAWYNRGLALEELGQFQGSVESYKKATKFNPDYDRAWSKLASNLERLGRSKEAIAAYDKVLEFRPQDAEAWYHRGRALQAIENYKAAIVSYDKAIEINPELKEVQKYRGMALSAMMGLP